MRKLTALLLLFAAGAFAQQLTLSVMNQGPVRAGNTLQLQANLTGSSAATMAALQLNLRATVPGTWTIQPGAVATAAGKQFSCAPPDATNQDYRCILYGMNANTIADGVVATISLDIPANAPTGQVSILPSNTLGASGAGDAVALAASSVNFTLASPLSPCDTNSDGSVNVLDVQSVISQILGLVVPSLDLDGDGKTLVPEQQRVVNAANGIACKVGR